MKIFVSESALYLLPQVKYLQIMTELVTNMRLVVYFFGFECSKSAASGLK